MIRVAFGRRLGACACLLLASLAPALSAAQQPYFSGPTNVSPDAHWTNYIRLADIDADSDLDVIVPNSGGFFQSPSPQPFQIHVNDGAGNFTNGTAGTVGAFSKSVRQVALGDVDGDGDLDLYVPDAGAQGPDRFFIHSAGGQFTDEAAQRLPGVSSTAGAVRFFDADGDGDLDLLVANGYPGGAAPDGAKLYVNDGTGVFAEGGSVPGISGGSDPDDIDVIDIDRDWDLDVLINLHTGKSVLWENDGAGSFGDVSGQMPGPDNHFHYGPVACDVDGDADLDIFVDNVGGNFREQLLINDGTGSFTDETAARITGNPGADDNGVACVDVDGDGDLDMAVVSLSDEERVLLNDGTGHFALSAGAFPATGDNSLWFDFGDVNGDGKLDSLTGQGEPPAPNKIYLGAGAAPADTRAPRIIDAEQVAGMVGAGATPIVRFAVSDNAVTDDGPRLEKAFLRVTAGATTEVPARFVGGDVFRAVLPPQSEQGAMVSYVACATDRQGNEGCSSPFTYTIAGTSSASGTTGSTGNGAGGAGATTGAGGGSGTATTGPGATGTGGSGGDWFEGDDGGCGCSVPGTAPSRLGLLAGLALVASLARRRRSAPRLGARRR